jgi:ATP adenylyltransferase
MEYITADKDNTAQCVFCVASTPEQDRERQILYRGAHAFVVMNRYPYANGHLLVVPYRHLADLPELTAPERGELFDLVCLAQQVLKETMAPQGFNMGLNLGVAAGAGIAAHLHWHIVPRWQGDTNFMPVVGELRVIPQHLHRTYELLAAAFAGRSLC